MYLITIFKSLKKEFIFISILSYILVLTSIMYTISLRYFIDNLFIINFYYLLYIIILYIFKTIIEYIKNIITIKTSRKISINLTNNIIESLILLPYSYYHNHQVGEIISRYNDTESIKEIINEVLCLITDLPLFIIMTIFIFYINFKIGIIIIILLIIYNLIYYYFNYIIVKKYINFKDEKAIFNSKLVESINNFESIKGINIEDKFIYNLKDNNYKLEQKIYKYQLISIIKSAILSALSFINSLLIIYICMEYNISVGSIVILFISYNLLSNPLTEVNDFIIKYKEALYTYKRISEFKIKNINGVRTPINYNINIKNMDYKIENNYILRNINLYLKHGSKVFITGPSGSGKSTLVKLIKGYYKTSKIYIGETKINRCLKDKIIYIGQNENIFRDTLYNNLFNDNKDANKIIKTSLVNKNLSLFLEEDGFNLSSGEKARIILARALSRDFEILIIDEALEEVDIDTERKILKNLFSTYKDKTIIVISHRLDNLDLYNEFIQVKNGEAYITNRQN